jgi:hypothetical protein
MMSATLLIFGLPMLLAAILISPTGLHDVIHGVPLCGIVIGLLLPFAAWPVFLSYFLLPPPGSGRFQALIRLWLGSIVMGTAVINLLVAVANYAPKRPGPAPTAGFLLAGLVLSMFISAGFWGALAPILSREFAIRGALTTGALLFLVVATAGFLLFG